MALDTSTSPYFDDYSEDKNFHRVLFKPGVAVQARELTQSQTILQNQVKRVSDYLFTDGTKVSGHNPTVNLDARTIRLKPFNTTGAALDVNFLLNKYVTSSSNDIVGYVEFVFEKDDPVIGDDPSIVISLKKYSKDNDGIFPENTELKFYNNYADALNKTIPNTTGYVATNITKNAVSTLSTYSKTVTLKSPTTLVEVGDLLVHPLIKKKIYVTKINSTTEISISAAPDVIIGEENIQYTKNGTCPTSIVIQDVAYFYKNGFIVRSGLQKIVPDKNTAFPSKIVALITSEQVITSSDDASLLDPAIGSSNYFAPGADRLQINLAISSFSLNADDKADTAEDHIPLLKFNRGELEFLSESTTNSVLQAQLAERTYDESGNYSVDQFKVVPAPSLDSSPDMVFKVSPGKAYVGGYLVSTVSDTEISVPKPISTDTKEGLNITTTQGNYIRITGLRFRLPQVDEIKQGDTHLELHNVTNPTSNTSLVGTMFYKNIEYDSSVGTGTQFRMFYHSYDPVKEVPATWNDWSAKYGISVTEGQYIADIFYNSATASTLLGNYGPANTPSYALFREPDVVGVVYWWKEWVADGKDIAKTKKKFAEFLLSNTSNPDYTRMISSTKSYATVSNGSPFYDGFTDVYKVKSIVGVSNSSTSHLNPSATYSAPFFYANISSAGIDPTTNKFIIYDKRPADTLVFPISKKYLQSIKNIRTSYTRTIRNAIFSNGIYTKQLSLPETFPLGDGRVAASTARTNFTVLIKSGATLGVPLGVFNFESGFIDISSTSSTATINLGDATFVGVADIQYTIESDNLPARTKTLNADQFKVITVSSADVNYSLQKSDVNITGIYNIGDDTTVYKGAWSPSTSYTYNQYVQKDGVLYKANVPTSNVAVSYSNAWLKINSINLDNWVLSNGQKDGWYDHGYIKYIGATSSLPLKVLLTYDSFDHSGDGPCTVDSYPASYYRKIGIYKSTVDATEYNLRDCLDFRPKRINDSPYYNFESAIFPTSSVNTDADVTYYLSRIDRLYITRDSKNFDNPYNKFYIETGIESNNLTKFDNSDKSKLAIATLISPPYPRSANDILIKYENIKRFTMQDIGKLETQAKKFDKAIRAHSVDISVLKSTIRNENNDALLKTGILVENFSDLSKAELDSGYFTCSIQTATGVCAPLFAGWGLNLDITAANDVAINRDIITAKYVEEVLASQLDGNDLTNPNPGAINDGRGRAQLSKQNSYKVNLLQTGIGLLFAYVAGQALTSGLIKGATVLWNGGTFAAAFDGAAASFIANGEVALLTIKTYAIQAFEAVSSFAGTAVTTVQGWLGLAPATPLIETSWLMTAEGTTFIEASQLATSSTFLAEASVFLDTAIAYAPYVVAAVVIIDAITGGAASEVIGDVVNGVGDVIEGGVDLVEDFFGGVSDILGGW
jgi:hypothetical protein